MAKTLDQQAEAVLKQHLKLGTAKRDVDLIGSTRHHQFTSVRSFKETASTLARIARALGVKRLKEIDVATATAYLVSRRDQISKRDNFVHVQKNANKLISQKTLDAERKALSIFLKEPISRIYSANDKPLASRAYTTEQINKIASKQSARNSLSTRIAAEAGLRASELFTLRKAEEINIKQTRAWHPARFKGVEGQRYIVVGKGGLVREIVLSHDTAEALEKTRFVTPQQVTDRGVRYTTHYDIAGGNSFSKSFGRVSASHLDFSNGAHGLRHTYAQSRLNEIKAMGYPEQEAKVILSQEIGHFRANITETYLR